MLEKYRKDLDEIDRQMMDLFEKRLEISKKVAEYKISKNMDVFQPERERIVIDKWEMGMKQADNRVYAKKLIETIMESSRDLQDRILEGRHMK